MNLLRYIVLLITISVSSSVINPTHSTHVIGGEIYYQCLDPISSYYRFTVKLYRDCFSGVPPYDDPIYVSVYDSLENLMVQFDMALPPDDTLDNNTYNICLFVPPDYICVQEAVYTADYILPPGRYHLTYQRCCRNQGISNIINPQSVGAGWDIVIPEPRKAACNSSPYFNNYPPTIICYNAPFAYDHSATDPDGDSLVYYLCTPNDYNATPPPGGYGIIPDPSGPPSANFDIPYISGYDSAYPIFAPANPFQIDPQTGWLTGTPEMFGKYQVGICVSEYRDVVHFSEDFEAVTAPALPGDLTSATIGSDAGFYTGDSAAANDSGSWPVPSHGMFAMTNDDVCDCDKAADYLTLPVLNFNGFYGSEFKFSAYADGASGQESTVELSVDGGAWNVIYTLTAASSWQDTTLALPASTDNKMSVRLRFHYDDNNSSATGFAVDDIMVQTPAVLLSTNKRDFEFNVAGCLADPLLLFSSEIDHCNLEVDFTYEGNFVATYKWDFGVDTIFSDTSILESPSYTYPGTGIYPVTLIVNEDYYCADTLTIPVTLPLPLSANYTWQKACVYEPVSFTDQSDTNQYTGPIVSWNWDFGDGNSDTVNQNTDHSYSDDVPRFVSLIVETSNNCKDTILQLITFYPLPFIDAGEDIYVTQGEEGQLEASGGVSYSWLPSTYLNNPNIYNPTVTPLYTTGYHVTGTSPDGCLGQDSVIVKVVDPKITVPNAFSPNGDGENDVIYLLHFGILELLEFKIFNRWGQLVFETSDMDVGWDGNFKGQPQEIGNFAYYYKATSLAGQAMEGSGDIALLR